MSQLKKINYYKWYNLNPILKFIFILELFIIPIIFTSPIYYLITLTFIIIISLENKVIKKILVFFRYGVYFCFLIIIFNVILNSNGTHYIYIIQIPHLNYNIVITWETVIYSLINSFSLILILISFGLINILVDPDQLNKIFSKLKLPYLLQFIIICSLRFFPLLLSDYNTIMDIQKSRGFELESKNLIKNLKNKMVLILPLLTNSLDRSIQIAEALESRGFGIYKNRSVYKPIKFDNYDKLILSLLIGNFILIGIIRLLGYGTYSLYISFNLPSLDVFELNLMILLIISNSIVYLGLRNKTNK